MRVFALFFTLLIFAATSAVAQQLGGGASNCEPKRYVVYFDFGQTGLMPGARDAIREAATYANQCPLLRVDVTTHLDTLEANTPTPLLEYGRGSAVSLTLQGYGVAGGRITEIHRDIRELAVQTPPNTREPLNRNVTINIHL